MDAKGGSTDGDGSKEAGYQRAILAAAGKDHN